MNVVSHKAKRNTRIVLERLDTRKSNEAMAKFARKNPHLMQYEAEFFSKGDHEH